MIVYQSVSDDDRIYEPLLSLQRTLTHKYKTKQNDDIHK